MPYSGYTVEEVEDAIIATLEDYPALEYVRIFDRLPWERVEEVVKAVKLFPALLVAYAGGSDDGMVGAVDHRGRFVVWCITKNVRSPSAALTGGASGDKGAYDLLKDVFDCLHYSSLGLDILECKSVRVTPLAASPGVVIFSREFMIEWRLNEA